EGCVARHLGTSRRQAPCQEREPRVAHQHHCLAPAGPAVRRPGTVGPAQAGAAGNGDRAWRTVRLHAPTDRLRPGPTLERAARRETHTVAVVADGFTYRGQRYRSLPQIARLITGTRWNGPTFFGLRQDNGKASAGSDDAS